MAAAELWENSLAEPAPRTTTEVPILYTYIYLVVVGRHTKRVLKQTYENRIFRACK